MHPSPISSHTHYRKQFSSVKTGLCLAKPGLRQHLALCISWPLPCSQILLLPFFHYPSLKLLFCFSLIFYQISQDSGMTQGSVQGCLLLSTLSPWITWYSRHSFKYLSSTLYMLENKINFSHSNIIPQTTKIYPSPYNFSHLRGCVLNFFMLNNNLKLS